MRRCQVGHLYIIEIGQVGEHILEVCHWSQYATKIQYHMHHHIIHSIISYVHGLAVLLICLCPFLKMHQYVVKNQIDYIVAVRQFRALVHNAVYNACLHNATYCRI